MNISAVIIMSSVVVVCKREYDHRKAYRITRAKYRIFVLDKFDEIRRNPLSRGTETSVLKVKMVVYVPSYVYHTDRRRTPPSSDALRHSGG